MVCVQRCAFAGNKSMNNEVPAHGESEITRDAFRLLFCVSSVKMGNETRRKINPALITELHLHV